MAIVVADIIELLPDYVANQIAAGEVVQRPASVVKELLENAVDAESLHIKLVIKESGKTLIQVIDNGTGMSMTDARMAFERHATSKIKTTEDLFSISTKGFRGEALASLAAVSQLECLTKTTSSKLGAKIKIEGGKFISQENIATSKGTSIAVKNLFFNIPARRNFLKSNPVEHTHIINEFQRVALAHPDIEFELHNEKGSLFRLVSSSLRDRIVNVFGGKTSEKLIPVKENTNLINIHGYIVKPEFSKKTRGEQFFFVNNRFVKSPYLHHAIISAFEGLLQSGHHPSYFLFFEIDPSSIDINIHPTKTEIKFEDDQAVYAILRSAVKHNLGQFNFMPSLDFDRNNTFDIPYKYKNKTPSPPKIEVDSNFNPFKEKEKFAYTSKTHNTNVPWEALYIKNEEQTKAFDTIEIPSKKISGDTSLNVLEENLIASSFQAFRKYIVLNTKPHILFIHQNRAHQRILFEDIKRQQSQKKSICQQLIFPLTLEFNTKEIEILNTLKFYLNNIGFSIDIKRDTISINSVPIITSDSDIKTLLEELISNYSESVYDFKNDSDKANSYIAKSLCKSLAVKTGEILDEKIKSNLIENLFRCEENLTSPFKKPIFIRMTLEDIEKIL